jgi:hypothetical protein
MSWFGDLKEKTPDFIVGTGKAIGDKFSDAKEAVGDKVDAIQEKAESAISTQLKDSIEGMFGGWIEELMNWILSMMNKVVFTIPNDRFVQDTLNFLGWFTSIFAVVLVLYKIVEYIINTQNGTQQYPLDEILLRAVKSAGAILVLPWILKLTFFDIALNLAQGITNLGTDFTETNDMYRTLLTVLGGSFIGASGGLVLILLLIFFLVVFIAFVYSVCVFYADYTIMMILTAPVALSMIADDNNYFQIWWREMLSMVTSMLMKLFLVTLVIKILFDGGNILLAIGAGALIIKQPSVLKNMWYAGGGARGAHGTVGKAGSMGSRMLMQTFSQALRKSM